MSLITHTELVRMCEDGIIQGVKPENINGASIDIALGDTFYTEGYMSETNAGVVDLAAKESPHMIEYEGPLYLKPGQFCLACSVELFNLPDDVAAMFFLKSSLARSGLDHLKAGWADPGWHGSVLTLEYRNVLERHTLILRPGMKAGQMVFMRGEAVPEIASYAVRGNYNNDLSAQPSKGAR